MHNPLAHLESPVKLLSVVASNGSLYPLPESSPQFYNDPLLGGGDSLWFYSLLAWQRETKLLVSLTSSALLNSCKIEKFSGARQ